MAFDPDAYLAAKKGGAPAGGGFDPDAYLAARAPAVAPEFIRGPVHNAELQRDKGDHRDHGALGAFGLNLLQGGTAGFFDEIIGAGRALTEAKDIRDVPAAYRRARDEERGTLHDAQEQHPVASTLGQLAGGAATAAVPLGPLAGLPGVAGHAARGAAAGIAAGAGASEAEDVGDIVADAAKGGLVGGATGAVLGTATDKLVKGAQGRVDKRFIGDVGDRATPTARRKLADLTGRLGGAGGEAEGTAAVAAVAREHGLDAVARDPAALAAKTAEAKGQVGRQLGELYDGVDGMVGGVPRSQVVRALHKVEQQYRTGGVATEAAADKVAKQIELLRERWGGYPSPRQDPLVPASVVNQLKSEIQEGAFRGTEIAPAVAKRAEQDASRAVGRILAKHVEDVAGPDAAAHLADLNKQYSVLATIGRAAKERERLEPFPQTGLRSIAHEVFSPAMLLLSGHPVAAAGKALAPVAANGVRVADQALARLYSASQAGNVTAQLIQQALEAGVPRGMVARFATGVTTQASGAE